MSQHFKKPNKDKVVNVIPGNYAGDNEDPEVFSLDEMNYLSPEVLQKRAELSAFTSNLSAALAKQALDNTAMLATIEAKCNQIAPGGSEEYRKILTAYVYREAMKIAGGEW